MNGHVTPTQEAYCVVDLIKLISHQHTQDGEAHCGAVQDGITCSTLQMNWYAIILLRDTKIRAD